ncbi:MAG: hypothetical protein OJF50_005400 [Nitrospira sp.]|jgi:hypothetical protein|nr:hypothetical protein [Nitrospira sp.]
MSLTSQSPERVAREALAVAATALPRYPHKFSPKIYTQPQLFACLVLKTFFTTDYRGIAQLLADLPELVRTLGLETVPHFTTLHKAARRLLRLPLVQRLLTVTIRRVPPRRRRVALAAMDSTGFECRHISAYSVRRRSRERSPGRPPRMPVSASSKRSSTAPDTSSSEPFRGVGHGSLSIASCRC